MSLQPAERRLVTEAALDDILDSLPPAGIPSGGNTGQVLAKKTADDYDTQWVTPASGGGGGSVTLSNLPAGIGVFVVWNGSWPTTRPTARADMSVVFIGGSTPPVPPVCMSGRDLWIKEPI